MRIGYGYKRRHSDFEKANVERIWIDHPGTMRADRQDLFLSGLRPGDTLVLLAPGDLGAGGEIPMLRRELERMNVEIDIVPTKTGEAGTPGRPGRFNPTKEQLSRLKRLYTNPAYGGGHVYTEACKMVGWKPTKKNKELVRIWLWRKFGKRGVQSETEGDDE